MRVCCASRPVLAIHSAGNIGWNSCFKSHHTPSRRVAAWALSSAVWIARICRARYPAMQSLIGYLADECCADSGCVGSARERSEEHTSELQSLMRISYAVFCLNKKKNQTPLTWKIQNITQ